MKKNHKGFSLIELLIVVAIILIIAAIAIPNLLKSKMAANESSAVGTVRTITTAEVTYSAACPAIGFSATLAELNTGALCAGGTNIVDNVLGQDPAIKSGYSGAYVAGAAVGGVVSTYTITNTPLTVGTTGQRQFCSDQTGVVRYTLNGAGCTNASPALQ
jgi:prepilin-type N-terminal cleavage/methylation domain-containing protein